jgi:hypothetical protein
MGQTMELWMFNKNAPSTRELFATHILEVDHVYGNRIEEHHFMISPTINLYFMVPCPPKELM